MPSSSAKSQMPRPSSVKFGPARPTRADVEVLLIQRVRGGGVPRELIIVAAVRHAVVPMYREASHTKSCLNTPNKAEPTKKPGTHPPLRPERSPRTACDSLDQDLPDADNLLLGANDAGAQLEAVMESKNKQSEKRSTASHYRERGWPAPEDVRAYACGECARVVCERVARG